ncbi:hypothetical protein GQ55_4G248500 [Panicum hallii var. hallii]|uniref:MBD domain-containing protein n=1 Tax=Panicum hallii var. hallii TaxID=1504633 RepID=A0A2T7DZV4_9POAL|nr:hypothetical protein GQ55_4G248500 [Panicum hallii var. hallii]
MVVYVPRVQKLKEQLPLPQWLKDYKSDIADSDGWQVEQVARADSYGRKDKYYTHRDYDHIFRSTVEVKKFLDTGEVRGKCLLQKKSSDPDGQSSGSRRRSTKRRMVLPTSDAIGNPQE